MKNSGLENYKVELRKGTWPHLLAMRGTSMDQPHSTWDSNVSWDTDKLHHHGPEEMLGNSGKLNVEPVNA